MALALNKTNIFYRLNKIGKNASDELRLSALDLKPNFKLMMVGSLEADIQDVCNAQFDNRDVIDDFDDDNNDEKSSYNFHKMEVCFHSLLTFIPTD